MSSPDIQRQRQLEMAVRNGDRARQRLIECNLRLVVSLAKRFRGCGLPFADLVQEGNIGLMEAVERYDHRRGTRFATYAGWWIQKAVRQAAAVQSRAIRLPVWVNDELPRLRRARADLEARLERRPTLRELAEEMGASVQRIQQLTKYDAEIVSLDVPVGDPERSELIDLIPDREASLMEEMVAGHLLREDVQVAIVGYLGPRDREILRMRFGLDGKEALTLDQVAEVLGVTRERVRQLERRALGRLRRSDELRIPEAV
jgi:RNA polymerase sigma factor (sigma-70 family)